MKKYRITKYDPKKRNDQGHYLYHHWTEISDVGKILERELVTKEEYFRIENDYIQSVVNILKESNQDYLRLVGLNKDKYQESLIENSKEWYHETMFEKLNLKEDQKISVEEVPMIIKLNLRRYLDTTLEIKDKFYVQFGYDFYMYVGAPTLSIDIIDKINSTSVFIEEFWSPYYSPELEYVLQSNKIDSMYVEDETILASLTIDKIKETFNLSEDHPGRIYKEVDNKTADKLGISVNLEKYEYYLTTELKIE